MEFSHKAIEKKWQKIWEEKNVFKLKTNGVKKSYVLDMFPYPSGSGLHVGHPKGYTATDAIARFKLLNGYDVMHPIGWDAFGLPAEQYALQTGNDPAVFTNKNIDNFRRQLKSLGYYYNYEIEVNTTDKNYYRTTQWIFSKLFEHGYAELKDVDVNWCEGLGTVLANEEIETVNGQMVSERGGFPVIKKPMKQWVLKITKFADELLEGLDDLEWPDSVKNLQKNWIGKSQGHNVNFVVKNNNSKLKVFTTRLDTIYGVSYIAISPENKIVKEICDKKLIKKIDDFINITKSKTDLERQDASIEKNGLFIGAYAINPINNQEVPIYIADYVLNSFANGAVMGVPGHDKRDFMFAKKYNLPITYIIENNDNNSVVLEDGKHINSEIINGLNIYDAKEILETKFNKVIEKQVHFKLRDWLFSRQRYWGEPFPIIHLENGDIVLEKNLPLELPKLKNITSSNTGESPLSLATDWLKVKVNGVLGTRETNTMPQWAGSCWYYLGYILNNGDGTYLDITSKEAQTRLAKWLPVDLYVGGQEHAVLHLLYARFWHKFLYKLNMVPTKEPFIKLINQGMILGEDGTKMSKSKGNVESPDDIVNSHGADTLRLYEMFMGPIEASLPWSFNGLDSSRKWLDRVFRMYNDANIIKENLVNVDVIKAYSLMIKNVTKMLENLQFNTAISQLMIFVNVVYKNNKDISVNLLKGFATLLSVFAPHLAHELYSKYETEKLVMFETWPAFDENILNENTTKYVIQVNGKLKLAIELEKELSQEKLLEILSNEDRFNKLNIDYKNAKKIIFIKNKIINFVL